MWATTLTALAAAACSGPQAGPTARGTTPHTAASNARASAATSTPPVAHPIPAGPPPKRGTLAWYVAQLPHFDAPPAPQGVTELPMTGAAEQIDQIAVGSQRVAFITIDDGWLKDPGIYTLLAAAHIPFTMFLTANAIEDDPSFFTRLEALGGVVEDHTVTHPKLSQMSYAQQVREICGAKATLTQLYGRAPIIMRAPYGMSNANTLKAAGSCGIHANVFWDEYALGGKVTWQRPGGIHPGDMVLMHFDKDFKANFLAALQAFHQSGITPALLENYLVTSPPTPPTPPSTVVATPSPTP